MSKQTRIVLIIALAVGLIIVFFDAVYVVSEVNQVIITQFGEPIGGAVTKPGLHIKAPFIHKTNYFEKRWLEWNGDANRSLRERHSRRDQRPIMYARNAFTTSQVWNRTTLRGR